MGCHPPGQTLRHSGGKAADAGLHEQVRGPLIARGLDLVADFGSDHPIASDHVIEDKWVSGIVRCIGNKNAVAISCCSLRGVYSIVVGPINPGDLCALYLYPPSARARHADVQKYAGGRVRQSSRRSDSQPVVAIARAE